MRMVCVVIVLLAVPGVTLGTVIQLWGSGQPTVYFRPGDTVVLDVLIIGAPVDVAAFDGFLTASASNVLSVTARTFGPQGFGGFPTSPSIIGPLNPSSPAIGGLNIAGNVPPADMGSDKPVETISVLIASDCTEQEVILLITNPIVSDGLGNALPLDAQFPLVIPIIPEPASLLLLGLGAPLLRRRRA